MNTSGHHVSRLCGAPRARQASSLRSDPFGAYGLDRPSGAPTEGNYVMARGFRSDVIRRSHDPSSKRGGIAMIQKIPSAVDVTIGGETRVYEAFVTTAPVALDRPSTVTLCESS